MTLRTISIVGTGAFVTRDNYGPGVVARSVAQWCALHGGRSKYRVVFIYRSDAGRDRIDQEWETILAETPDAPEYATLRAGTAAATDAIESSHALFIAVPDSVHDEYLRLGIDAGIPTWIVKPLTGNGTRSREIIQRADQSNVPIWVDYHKRFDVSNRLLKSAIADGRKGRPRLYSVRYSQPRDLPLDGFAWTLETDVFSYIGCHYVDQLLYLMPGLNVLDISARGVPGPVFEEFGRSTWDTVLARFDCEWRGSPLTAQFEVSWSNPLGSPTKSLQVVEMAFDREKIFLDQTHRGIEQWSDEGVAVPNPHFFSRISDPLSGQDAYQGYGYESIAHFLDWTVAPGAIREAARANESLPWARSAAAVDVLLDRVADAVAKSACT